MKRPAAFTLVETVAVLAVLAAVAGIGLLSLRGLSRVRGASEVASDLAMLDAWARRTAPNRGAALVRYSREGAVGSGSGGAVVREVRMPTEVAPMRLATGMGAEPDVIIYSATGRCGSYAVEIQEAPDRKVWLLVCGLTGDVQEASDERAAEAWVQRFGLIWHEFD